MDIYTYSQQLAKGVVPAVERGADFCLHQRLMSCQSSCHFSSHGMKLDGPSRGAADGTLAVFDNCGGVNKQSGRGFVAFAMPSSCPTRDRLSSHRRLLFCADGSGRLRAAAARHQEQAQTDGVAANRSMTLQRRKRDGWMFLADEPCRVSRSSSRRASCLPHDWPASSHASMNQPMFAPGRERQSEECPSQIFAPFPSPLSSPHLRPNISNSRPTAMELTCAVPSPPTRRRCEGWDGWHG